MNEKEAELIGMHVGDGTLYKTNCNSLVWELRGSIYEKEYYEDGNPLKEGPIVNDKRDGRWKSYYRDGTLWSEGDYANGVREGLTKSYFPNGKLRYEGNFTNGVKSGQWNFYNENGTFEKMATFMAPGQKDTITLELPSQDTQEDDR